MVTVLLPTRSGTLADQFEVPEATPDEPKLVAQATNFRPPASLAMPVMVTDAELVDRLPVEGEVTVSVGGVVSGDPGGGVEMDCRVMVTERDTRLVPVDAVTVIVFDPITSGTLSMLHAAGEPVAASEAPLLDDQVTAMAPEPPEAEPASEIEDALVATGGVLTTSVRAGVGAGVGPGAGLGVGLGAGFEVCAA
jgi:hypothetical protein